MAFDFQMYRLVDVAREKLWHEAARPDHNLHQLMLHANLLDELLEEIRLLELHMAEEEDDDDEQVVMARSTPGIQDGNDAGVVNKKNMLPGQVLRHSAPRKVLPDKSSLNKRRIQVS